MARQFTDVHVPWLDAEAAKTLPVFLVKLIRMLEDRQLNDMICWDPTGTSFHIIDAPRFCDSVLPHYFKHRNLNSFVRQLNFYGFRKLAAADKATLTQIETFSDDLHFIHPKFVRGRTPPMYSIKRQTNPTKKLTSVAGDNKAARGEGDFVSVPQEEWLDLNDRVNDLQSRNEELSQSMEGMYKDQQMMFEEVRILRTVYQKQSDAFNKLMSYLINVVNPSKKVHRRPRPYVDQSAPDNFMIATRNSGDVLSLIQQEFQEGLHITKRSIFEDEVQKDGNFEYYGSEYYDENPHFEQFHTEQPPALQKQNNQVALTRPKHILPFGHPSPKKELRAATSAIGEVFPSTSYVQPGEGHDPIPTEFLQTPPAESPIYLSKREPIQHLYNYEDDDDENNEYGLMENNEYALMDYLINPSENVHPEWAETDALSHNV